MQQKHPHAQRRHSGCTAALPQVSPSPRFKIRALKVLPGSDKKPPNFLTLLNHAAAGIEKQQPSILDSLNRAVTRGDKLLTGPAKEILDMMFKKLIIHEDLPFNLGESTYFNDFMLEVSKGSYKGVCDQTLRGLVSVFVTVDQVPVPSRYVGLLDPCLE